VGRLYSVPVLLKRAQSSLLRDELYQLIQHVFSVHVILSPRTLSFSFQSRLCISQRGQHLHIRNGSKLLLHTEARGRRDRRLATEL
jgi:hypothetical protein